jgi:hypothetical protein
MSAPNRARFDFEAAARDALSTAVGQFDPETGTTLTEALPVAKRLLKAGFESGDYAIDMDRYIEQGLRRLAASARRGGRAVRAHGTDPARD